jgi:hypothetical protein
MIPGPKVDRYVFLTVLHLFLFCYIAGYLLLGILELELEKKWDNRCELGEVRQWERT